jgi:hypothetical protein
MIVQQRNGPLDEFLLFAELWLTESRKEVMQFVHAEALNDVLKKNSVEGKTKIWKKKQLNVSNHLGTYLTVFKLSTTNLQ